jgi:amino acid adenylation domain-containing protein
VASPSRDRLRAAYLRNRLSGRARQEADGPGSVSRGDPARLSFAQQRLWFLEQLAPGGAAYLVPWVLRLRGPVDVGALRGAVAALVARHEVLRTRYVVRDGSPVQVVDDVVPLDWAVARAERGDVDRVVGEWCRRPVDLVSGPVVRARLLECGPDEHVLVVVLHHVACDGWSVGVLARELRALYGALATGCDPGLAPVPVQYADFAAWQREWLSGARLERELGYWRERLSGVTPLELPTDRPRPVVPDDSGDTVEFLLPHSVGTAVRDLARRHDATVFMVLLAAYQALLSRYCQQDDVVVGTPVAGRQRPELRDAVGLYANTVVLRADLSGDPVFGALVAQVRDTAIDAFSHQDLPFERLVEELDPVREVGRNPVFQAEFVLQNNEEGGFATGGLVAEEVLVDNGTAKFDLSLRVVERADGSFLAAVEYATALFDRTTIERLTGHYREILADALAHPGRRVSGLRLLTPAEEAWWAEHVTGHATTPPVSGSAPLHELFLAQRRRRPDAVAVVDGDRTLTYAELDDRSARLAARLRALGAGPGTLVGISLPRSAEVVVAVLAVLRTGAAYVPLDPGHPADRVAYTATDANVRLVVTDGPGADRLPPDLEAVTPSTADGSLAEPEPAVPGDAPAYVIYTSGSTGRPKGVVATHRNVVGLVAAARPLFSFGENDTWTLFHSYAFDVSVWEIWGALLHGGRVVVVPGEVARSPEDLLALVLAERVTVLSQTPSAFLGFVDAVRARPGAPGGWHLRHVAFAGEALDLETLRPWFEVCGTAGPCMVNLYGITETTVHSTYRAITPSDVDCAVRSPIGRGMPGLRVIPLDRFLNPVPVGVPGELFVGGDGVTLGYLDRPALTAERYLPDPYGGPGQRMYRSGDRARLRPDGELEFLGRIDNQVKIRGFRVEPGEIESCLRLHPDLGSCAVVARALGAGDHQLLAYVTPAPGAALDVGDLRRHLTGTLPAYMVPAHITVLDALPITTNGKADTAALPAPDDPRRHTDATHVAPRTITEQVAATVWSEVLGLDRVGVTDSFFELGGDSIRAVRLVGRLGSRGIAVSVQDVFRHPTVAGLVAAAGETDGHAQRPVEPFALLPEGARAALPEDVADAYPLSMLQAGMLYELLADADLRLYHNVTTYPIDDDASLDGDALLAAATALVERHESLRTGFDITGDEPLQRVHRHAAAEVVVADLRGQGQAAQRAAVDECVRGERERPFDLRVPPLMRWHAFALTDRTWLLVVTECHAVVDGWSHNSLLAELLAAHRAIRAGLPGTVAEPPAVRVADFVALERHAVDSDTIRSFWQTRLGDRERLAFPATWGDRDAPETFHSVRVELADLEPRLHRFAADCAVPVKSVLLAAHVTALGVITGQRRFHTGLVCNGRPERDGGDLVAGMFLNSVPLTVDLDGRTGREVVAAVFREEVDLSPHRRYPLPLMQRQWGDGRPLLDAVFNYLDFHVLDRETVVVDEATDDSPNEFPLHVTTEPGVLLLTGRSGRLSADHLRLLGQVHRAVLERFATTPDAPATVGVLPADLRRSLVATGNDIATALPEATLPELVAAQARATPHRTALVADHDRRTYADLDRAVDRLAAHLRGRGAGPGTWVGVCLPRRTDLVVSLLAVLRTGAAYLPLDPEHPPERRRAMLTDAGTTLLLTDGTTGQDAVPGGVQTVVVPVPPDVEPAATVTGGPCPDDAAYVIYTSGSTGTPKGVVVQHRALTNFLTSMRQRPGLGDDDVLLAVTTVSFDISILELFLPLTCGATVVLADRAQAVDAEALAALVAEEGVTALQATPATWRLLREVEWRPPTRLLALCGGEKLPPDLAAWLAETGVAGWDMYGPTETTIWSSTARIGAGGVLADWAPVANTTIHVLDADLQPVLPGVAGELYIGGAGVALGYRGRGDLTADRFVPDPHGTSPGSRLYRTGDSAVRHPDGRVEILGRLDHQVKIRGHRVEPGEAEAVLLTHPAVTAAVVHPTTNGQGDLQLTAYVAGLAEPATAADLRAHLAARLPGYLVPASFVIMAELPLTSSGKVDRRALPAPGAGPGDEGPPLVEPRTDDETVLAEVWAEALGVPRVGVYDDFVALGGHSLIALRIVSRARARGVTVHFRDLMARRTITGVLAGARTSAPDDALVWFRRTGARPPLFCVHPGGGSAHWFAHLTRELDADQPLAAFEWPGLHGAADHPGSVARIARRYLAELREAQPDGPVRLLGWCGGSAVTWEMARLLREEDGRRVDLFLLDPVVDMAERANFHEELATFWRFEELFNELAYAADDGAKDRLAAELVAILDAVVDDQRGDPVTGDQVDAVWRDRVRVWRHLLETGIDYVFSPMPGRLHLLAGDEIVAAEHEVIHGLSYRGYLDRWEELSGGGVAVHRVPGDHLGVLRPPQVATLAAVLTGLLTGGSR